MVEEVRVSAGDAFDSLGVLETHEWYYRQVLEFDSETACAVWDSFLSKWSYA